MRAYPLLLCLLFLPSVSAAKDRLECGKITEVGCCARERLFYCEKGALRILDCRKRPRCGWRKTGRFDCDTAGASDPKGRYSKSCFIGKDKPPVDLGVPDSSCGDVPVEGCCFGDELRLCQDGKLRTINCRDNRFCGWRGVGQAYNCGTEGKPDPKGKYPRNCAGAPDSGPLRFPDAAVLGQSPSGGAANKGGCAGCACEVSAQSAEGLPLAASLLLMALIWRRRRP